MNQGADGGCWCEGGRDLGRGAALNTQNLQKYPQIKVERKQGILGFFRPHIRSV